MFLVELLVLRRWRLVIVLRTLCGWTRTLNVKRNGIAGGQDIYYYYCIGFRRLD